MKKNLNANNDGRTEQTGYAFVSSSDMSAYCTGPINALKILELTDNAYVSGPITQTANMVLSDAPTITVYDDKDDVVEDVSRKLNVMFSTPKCSIAACARSAIVDLIQWGPAIYNWVWRRNETGELVCEELNHLHPYTFSRAPQSNGNDAHRSYGRLLYGIFYDATDRKVHYYQMPQRSGPPEELPRENLFVIQDPSDQYPDGESVIYPVAPLVDFLNYAWNTAGQQLFRTGAPIIFIKIENPQPERQIGGEIQKSDVEYAREILANWGKDTQFPLRQNMEIISVDVKEGSLAIISINKATETIRDYFSPTGMLGRDGTLIAGNQSASLKLYNNFIRGWVSLLQNALNELPSYYLKHNGYPDTWRAEVNIPHNTFENTGERLQQAQLLANTKAGSPNEVRELLGLEGVGDDELGQMRHEWEMLGGSSAQQQPQFPPMFAANSTAPNRISRIKRKRIAREAEAAIDDGTDDLLHAALRAARKSVEIAGKRR